MKTLLVLTDFSYSSFNAARYAALLARSFDSARLILYHSFYPVPVRQNGLIPDALDVETFKDDSLNRLSNLEVSLQPFLAPSIIVKCLADEQTVARAAKAITFEYAVDLVIMGSRGRSAVEHILFGSQTEAMMENSSVPLLVIPPEAKYEPIAKSLFVCDLKHTELIPVGIIKELIKSLNCRLEVLNVDEHKGERADTGRILEQGRLHRLLGEDDIQYHYTNNHDIEGEIDAFAAKQHAGLLIVIHKKHGFFHKLLHASTTSRLISDAEIPLLVLKESANFPEERVEFKNYAK